MLEVEGLALFGVAGSGPQKRREKKKKKKEKKINREREFTLTS